MAVFNCVLFFRVRDTGWSERYYFERDNYIEAEAALLEIQAARLALTPVDVVCEGRRVSRNGVPRDGFVHRYDTSLAANKGAWNSASAAEWVNMADDAILLHHTDFSRFAVNRRFFRGYPDTLVKSHGPSADFATWWAAGEAVDGYFWKLVNLAALMKHKGDFNAVTFTPIGITRFAGFTTRRPGRPLGLRPGRRSTGASA